MAIPKIVLHEALDTERDMLDYNTQAFYDENHPKLNNDQCALFHEIVSRVANDQGGIVFYDAPAGTRNFLCLCHSCFLEKIRLNSFWNCSLWYYRVFD